METLRRLPLTDCDVIQKLEQISDISALSKEDRMKYDESIKVYRDNEAVLEFALEKGRAEERLRNALSMKENGIPAELIARITGLSMDEIQALGRN